MKKLLLLVLLNIFSLSFAQKGVKVPRIAFPDVDSQIAYIKKFDNWKYAIDNFETLEDIVSFFGDFYFREASYTVSYDFLISEIQKGEDQRRSRSYTIYIDFKNTSKYVSPNLSTRGTVGYNSLSNTIDINSTTTYSSGGTYNRNYWISFEFSTDRIGGTPFKSPEFILSNKIKKISFGDALNQSNNKEFLRLIQKYYSDKQLKDVSASKPKPFSKIKNY